MLGVQMDLDQLIELAFNRTPTQAEVEEAASFERVSVEAVPDTFARRVAERYLERVCGVGDADFAWSTAVAGTGLPEFAGRVFDAFDAGEFVGPGAPKDEQGEDLTQKLLSGCLRMEP